VVAQQGFPMGALVGFFLLIPAVLAFVTDRVSMKGEFDFDLHALRRIQYIGVTFRTRSLDEVREIGRRMWSDLAPAVADGTLSLPISATFPFERLGDAFATMKANLHFGKIVVTVA
jgi:NADPH2:quinone reductase